jgi:hypothetical protein
MATDLRSRAPLTGVLFAVLLVLSFVLAGESPVSEDSAEKIATYYKDKETMVLFASLLMAQSAVALVFFASWLAKTLRGSDGRRSSLPGAMRAGAAVAATGLLIFASLSFTMANDAKELDDSALKALAALNTNLFFPLVGGLAAFMLATGLLALRGGPLPRWMAWVAVAAGIACMSPAGFFGFVASGLWILVAAIMLTMRPGPAPGAA